MKKILSLAAVMLLLSSFSVNAASNGILGGGVPSSGGGTPAGSTGDIQTNGGSGAFGSFTPGTGVQTFLTTPSSANLLSALTTPLNAATVTTNANLTGPVTSVGNATSTVSLPTSYYNVKDASCGAVGNGVVLSDITTTASSATISSASHTFVSGDVGKLITVSNGPAVATTGNTHSSTLIDTLASTTGVIQGMAVIGSGVPAGAVVVSVNNSSAVTISVATTTTLTTTSITFLAPLNSTISGVSAGNAVLASSAGSTSITGVATATFGTNDTTAIQTCVTNATNAGGGTVFLPTGIYIVNASLNWGNKVSLDVAPPAVLKYISTSDMSTAVIYGYTGTCSVPTQPLWSGIKIHGVEIDVEAATLASYANTAKAISLNCTTNMVIDHTYTHGSPATCIGSDGDVNASITNNIASNCGRTATSGNGANGLGFGVFSLGNESYNIIGNIVLNVHNRGILVENENTATSNAAVVITGNYVLLDPSNTSGTPGGIDNETIGGTITGNTIVDLNTNGAGAFGFATGYGIAIDAGTTNKATGVENVVSSNYISGGKYGILVNATNAQAPTTLPNQTIITDNMITSAGVNGINLIGNSSTVQDTIKISNNIVDRSSKAGVSITGAAGWKNVQINNNVFSNNGLSVGSGPTASGVYVDSNITNFDFLGNRTFDDNTSTQKYGLAMDTGFSITGANISNNNFTGVTIQAVDAVGTITGNINGNVAMNAPTLSGACSSTTPVGNGDIGTFTSGTTGSCATTVLMYGSANIIQNHGYVCNSFDATTTTDTTPQTASTTTTATFTGVTVSGDVINFGCRGW